MDARKSGHDEFGRTFNFPFIKWKHPCASLLPREAGGAFDIFVEIAVGLDHCCCANLGAGRNTFREGSPGHRGEFAIGKCGAYGEAYDYTGETGARAAALKQCKGGCTALTMNRSCAALSTDMANPCGAHGYAVETRISSSLNEATRKCHELGGKECVIRAWACDARG